jgi:uncharacterized membrane protein
MTESRISVTMPARRVDRARAASRVGSWVAVSATAWPALLAGVSGLAAMVWVGGLLVRRVDALWAQPYDLGFFQQVIWNVGANGQWVSSFHEGSFLGLHFSPILVIPALVERLIWADVRVLSLFHAVAIGALVPAAFLFLRAALRPSRVAAALAAAISIGIPVWGTMQEVIRSDFRPEMAGVVLALLAGWAGLTGRPRALWALAIVALATREDVAYAVGVIGLVVAARGRGNVRRQGWILAAVAASWAVIVFGLLMPWIRDGAASDTDSYYAWLGGGLSVLAAPFTMTDAVVAALTRPAPWFVVAGMVASLVGLPLLRPAWAFLVLPPLVALLLSAHVLQAEVRLQYPLILVVPLLVAAALGGRPAIAAVTRLRRRWRRRGPADPARVPTTSRLSHPVPRKGLLLLAAVPAIAGAWVQGSLPPFDKGDPAFVRRPASIDRLRLVAASVPEQALLVTDEGLVAPLAGRSAVARLAAADVLPEESYVLIDRIAWSPGRRAAQRHERIEQMLESGTRPMLADDGRFVLWGPQPGEGMP